jgi:hypothetical protein
MAGRVVVDNNTGRTIRAFGCGTLFRVALVSNTYKPAVAWPVCLQVFTIPVGQSSYPAPVMASYLQCSARPRGPVRACLPSGHPPPLPAGDYRARLFQSGKLVPVPPVVTVRVTSLDSAR